MGKLKWSGTVEALTDATPNQVWTIVSDITRVGEWSHECRSGAWLGDAGSAMPGARFTGRNQVGRVAWSRTCEIVAADAPHELVWRTVPSTMFPDSTEWRITIEPHGVGARIVQTYRILKMNPVLERLVYLTTKPHRNRVPALESDVGRLGVLAASSEPSVAG
jgi:hypothetical protein